MHGETFFLVVSLSKVFNFTKGSLRTPSWHKDMSCRSYDFSLAIIWSFSVNPRILHEKSFYGRSV